MKYIVAGPTIINDIVFADKTEKKQILGGSIYCVAGIKLWEDSCLYVSNVGEDFATYYGAWMQANHCSDQGLRSILPHTWYTKLTYEQKGLHDETSIYGAADETVLEALDVLSAGTLADSCSADTKGIYIETSEDSAFWEDLSAIRSASRAKIMWELPTSAAMDPARKEKVLSTIPKADIYSVNLPEACSLFGVTTEEAALEAIHALGIPCFFRVGKRGSYFVENKKASFAASLCVGPIADPTGCGNVSTATALYAWCEGHTGSEIARMANISAAYNLLQYGPFPAVTPAVRADALRLLRAESTESAT
ncbi:MAG: carbohydrate kinase family protein [Ruthenibacterium sp.]